MKIITEELVSIKALEFTFKEAMLIMRVVGETSLLERTDYMSKEDSRLVSNLYSKWYDSAARQGRDSAARQGLA